MPQTSNLNLTIESINKGIENGDYKIPQFQREFVWDIEKAAKLIDSIVKGYPIGSFIFWKTKERLRTVKGIGGLQFPMPSDEDYINYVLDGQQRITSIYAAITGAKIGDVDYSKIYIDLNKTAMDEDLVTTNIEGLSAFTYISIKDVYSPDLGNIVNNYSSKANEINGYRDTMIKYPISGIQITDAPLETATEIFTRLNTTGKALSPFEIMCAKTYQENPLFDLYEEREKQLANWQQVSYETIPDQIVLQTVAICLKDSCVRGDILSIKRSDFIKIWPDVTKALNSTIDFFRKKYHIPVSKLMPYDSLIVPFAYYFYKNNNKRPTGNADKWLKDYFWRSVLTKRFTEGVAGKLEIDCKNIITPILNNKRPAEKDLPVVDISAAYIERNGEFSVGSAYIKGLLCLFASKSPKSFGDNLEVTIDNAWLSQSNSKNYHHFFPKAYMKKNQPMVDADKVNHIVNITIVDEFINKSEIKAKAPSVYMQKYKSQNSDLATTMKSHLIGDFDKFGINNDDYDAFFTKRLEEIRKELKKNLIKLPGDVGI